MPLPAESTPLTRRVRSTWLAVCVSLFAIIAALVHLSWRPLLDLDAHLGSAVRLTPLSDAWKRDVWLWLADLTDTPAMTGYTVLIVLLLLWRRQRRTALWVALTMTTVGVLNATLKVLFARQRPQWDDPIDTLPSYSFPSGHSSGIVAFAGVVLVLTALHAAHARVSVGLAAGTLVLLVGVDRILLGVHNLSDVIAGYLLGAAVVLFWLLVLPPARHGILSRGSTTEGTT